MSLIKNKNNKGDNGSPCLTPKLLQNGSVTEPCTLTYNFTFSYISVSCEQVLWTHHVLLILPITHFCLLGQTPYENR